MRPLALAATVLAFAAVAAPLRAQEGTLDVLDGETLYDGGWLLTLGYDEERREGLRTGEDSVPDPLGQERIDRTAVLAAHWGARHDLQLSAIVPFVDRDLEGGGGLDLEASGLGDASLVAKWRFYRWDAKGKALNVALIGGLELPTGSDDETDGGAPLPPDLQPGSGSWDPLLGVGWHHAVNPKFDLHATFEGGGFGVGADVDISTAVRFDWKPATHFGITGGYSLLYFTLSDTVLDRKFTAKQTLHGPVIGIGLYF